MGRLLGLLRPEHTGLGTFYERERHNATLRRADRLLRVAAEYAAEDKARRDHHR